MIRNNDDIWLAGAFNDKRFKPVQLCGRSRFLWKGVFTVVERISLDKHSLIIVVGAASTDCRNPSEHDLRNAALSSVVVLKQRQFRRYRKHVRTYLEFSSGALTLIDLDVAAAEKQIRQSIVRPRKRGQLELPVMTALLSYLSRDR
jgi:hypothetical protein